MQAASASAQGRHALAATAAKRSGFLSSPGRPRCSTLDLPQQDFLDFGVHFKKCIQAALVVLVTRLLLEKVIKPCGLLDNKLRIFGC